MTNQPQPTLGLRERPADRIMTVATLIDRLREAVRALPPDAPPQGADCGKD